MTDSIAFAGEVRAMLDRLDRTDRTALALIYFHGLTQREVAKKLRLKQSAVTASVARGMRELSEQVLQA